jgi:hypothetical protein
MRAEKTVQQRDRTTSVMSADQLRKMLHAMRIRLVQLSLGPQLRLVHPRPPRFCSRNRTFFRTAKEHRQQKMSISQVNQDPKQRHSPPPTTNAVSCTYFPGPRTTPRHHQLPPPIPNPDPHLPQNTQVSRKAHTHQQDRTSKSSAADSCAAAPWSCSTPSAPLK